MDPQTSVICVNTLKKDWTTEVTLKHILMVIRCLLIVPFPESALNCEAGKNFMENYEEYAKRARIMTEVHALPIENDNENEQPNTKATQSDKSSLVVKQSATQKKEKDAKKKNLRRL